MRTRFHTCDAYIESVTPTIEDLYCGGQWCMRYALAHDSSEIISERVHIILYHQRAFYSSRKTTANVMRYIREQTGFDISARLVKSYIEADIDYNPYGTWITYDDFGRTINLPIAMVRANEPPEAFMRDTLYHYRLEA